MANAAFGRDHCLVGHTDNGIGNTFNTYECGPHFGYAANASAHARDG